MKRKDEEVGIEVYIPDVKERERIFALPDLERELIIHERYKEYKDNIARQTLLAETNDRKKNIIRDSPESGEIGRKRKKNYDYDDGDYEFSDDKASDYSMPKKKMKKKLTNKYVENKELNLDEEKNEYGQQINDDDTEFILNEKSVESIKLSRLFFEKYNWHKTFNSGVLGCFVRLNVGGSKSNQSESYMLAKIKSIEDNGEPYKIGDNTYYKWFIASHADNERKFNFSFISNGPVTEKEFLVWKSRMERKNLLLPNKAYFDSRIKKLDFIKNYKFSKEEIVKLTFEKKKERILNRHHGINPTVELEHMKKQMEAFDIQINELSEELFKCNELMKNIISSEYINQAEAVIINIEFDIDKYKKKKAELQELVIILEEMADKKIKLLQEKNKNEIGFKINSNNLINQKKIDDEIRLQNKHKEKNEEINDNEVNPFKRRECLPLSRFITNKNVYDSSKIKLTNTEDLFVGTPREFYVNRTKFLKETSSLFDNAKNDLLKYIEENDIKAQIELLNERCKAKTFSREIVYSTGISYTNLINNHNVKMIDKYGLKENNLDEIEEFKII